MKTNAEAHVGREAIGTAVKQTMTVMVEAKASVMKAPTKQAMATMAEMMAEAHTAAMIRAEAY